MLEDGTRLEAPDIGQRILGVTRTHPAGQKERRQSNALAFAEDVVPSIPTKPKPP
jgi:hypothetical protein